MYLAGSSDNGSADHKSRLGRIDGNEIVYLTTLKNQNWPFNFGICTGDVDDTHALLCTPMNDRKHCMLWDGKTGWAKTQVNKDKHYKGGVAKWTSSSDSTVAIIFAGREDSNGYTERLKHNTRSKTWEWKTDSKKFSDFKNYHYFSSVTFDNYVYMFGGQIGEKGKVVSNVFRYDGKWHKERVKKTGN